MRTTFQMSKYSIFRNIEAAQKFLYFYVTSGDSTFNLPRKPFTIIFQSPPFTVAFNFSLICKIRTGSFNQKAKRHPKK